MLFFFFPLKQLSGQEHSSVKCKFLGSAEVHGILRAHTSATTSSSGPGWSLVSHELDVAQGMILLGQLPSPQMSCHCFLHVGGKMDGWGCLSPTEAPATPPYGPCRKDKTKLVSLSKKVGLYLPVIIPLGFI